MGENCAGLELKLSGKSLGEKYWLLEGWRFACSVAVRKRGNEAFALFLSSWFVVGAFAMYIEKVWRVLPVYTTLIIHNYVKKHITRVYPQSILQMFTYRPKIKYAHVWRIHGLGRPTPRCAALRRHHKYISSLFWSFCTVSRPLGKYMCSRVVHLCSCGCKYVPADDSCHSAHGLVCLI